MKLREDSWLSEIFGCPVFKVETDYGVPDNREENVAVCNLIRDHGSRHPVAMYFAKIDVDQIQTVRQLAGAGFYVVDVNVTFGLPTIGVAGGGELVNPRHLVIREITTEDHRAVLQIAASCFRYSRFHLDPLIPTAIANRIKHDWVLNYIRKQRGEQLWVPLNNGQPAGFLAVLASDEGERCIRAIDLIGVDTAVQGRGLGASLVAFFIDRYAGQCDFLQVGTQVANLPSIKLYQKFGFAIVRAQYVLHKHVRA